MLASAFTTVANYRSRCSPAPAKIGMRTGVHPRMVKRPQPSRIVGRAGWFQRLFSPEPIPPPKPQLDVTTVGLYVITVVVMIMLTMSIKADISAVKDDLNKNISAVKDGISAVKDDLKSLSNKFDKLDEKYNEVKVKNTGLNRLVVQLQNDVNIALLASSPVETRKRVCAFIDHELTTDEAALGTSTAATGQHP